MTYQVLLEASDGGGGGWGQGGGGMEGPVKGAGQGVMEKTASKLTQRVESVSKGKRMSGHAKEKKLERRLGRVWSPSRQDLEEACGD